EIASFMSQQSFYLNHDLHEANRSLISTLLRKMPSTNQIVKDHFRLGLQALSSSAERNVKEFNELLFIAIS
ncbi:hypothetical protein, partial [Bremerella alba]|uniref:hypothetical protein n=1 Tax=Bremerella alba TaxID=980252 RepID=UPI001A955E14